MNDTKAVTPADYCKPIRDLYRSVQEERDAFISDLESAGRRVDQFRSTSAVACAQNSMPVPTTL